MKNKSDNRSFDDLLKDRLYDLEGDFSPDSWAQIKGNIAKPNSFFKGIRFFSMAVLSLVFLSIPNEFGIEERIVFYENEAELNNGNIALEGDENIFINQEKVNTQKIPAKNISKIESFKIDEVAESYPIKENKDHDRKEVGEGLINDQKLAPIQSQNLDVKPNSLHLTLLSIGHKPEPLSFVLSEIEDKKKPFPCIKKPVKPWLLQAYVAPLFSYGNFSSNQADPVLITGIEPYRRFSKERLGFSAHIGVEKMLSDKLSLYGGISYQMVNYQTSFNYRSVEPDSVITTITADNQLVVDPVFENQQANTQNIYHLVGLDIGAKYILSARKVTNYLKADVGARVIPFAVFKADGENKRAETQELLKESNFTVSFAYGMEYKIGDRLGFRVEPGLVGYLNPFQSESGKFSLHLYSFHINTGISYRLSKRQWGF